MHEASHWVNTEDGKVRCRLCPHMCGLGEGEDGICRNKRNVDGKLIALRYGEITALGVDPVEKKPLYHFFPGRGILSVGTFGCNLSCAFCQNHHLWNGRPRTEPAPPAEIVAAARRAGSFGIAYTYNEPFMSYEYVLDCARLAREAGLKNALVTNGYYNPGPFEELAPYIDAINVDLKSIRDDFYRKLCNGRVGPVKRTIERAAKGCLVEVTNLLVTGENDSDDDIAELVDWVAGIGVEVPLHFSAYHPTFKLANPATPLERLERAYTIASARLQYVYLGNVRMGHGSDTRCPHCQALLVSRRGYRTTIENLAGNQCGACGKSVNFVTQ